jgi:hypothetical protein
MPRGVTTSALKYHWIVTAPPLLSCFNRGLIKARSPIA